MKAVNPDYEIPGRLAVTLDDIRRFRQPGSHAPGHPEYHLVSGVETTTGPLGQGIATSVGMAIAQKWLAARYNQPDFPVFDYNVYATCGDGCLMEGVGAEAASLAGHLELDNLCWIYDNNHITIEGNTRIAFTEDVAARFLGYQWNVLRVGDANDLERIEHALTRVPGDEEAADAHRARHAHRLGLAAQAGHGRRARRAARRRGGASSRSARTAGPRTRSSWCPTACREHFAQGVGARGAQARRAWEERFAAYRARYPALAAEIDAMQTRELPGRMGPQTCRRSRPTRRASPAATRRRRC